MKKNLTTAKFIVRVRTQEKVTAVASETTLKMI